MDVDHAFCYVLQPNACAEAIASTWKTGTAWKYCTMLPPPSPPNPPGPPPSPPSPPPSPPSPPPLIPGGAYRDASKVVFTATISSSRRRMLAAVNITDVEAKTRTSVTCVSPVCELVVTVDSVTNPQQITFTFTDRSEAEADRNAFKGRVDNFVDGDAASELSTLYGITTITAVSAASLETIKVVIQAPSPPPPAPP